MTPASSTGITDPPDPGRSPGRPRRGRRGGITRLSRVEQIKRFAIVPGFWEPDGDEITPNHELKWQAITAKYADIAESRYTTAH
jgi:long-subunit acyl-CoA synthetase (AMP-forming)